VAASDHVGVPIVRVWTEDPGDPTTVRARITDSFDVRTDERIVAGATTVTGSVLRSGRGSTDIWHFAFQRGGEGGE
jgi:hypothetical protein